MKKTLYVISHTHWDREWYQDFQKMRIRLVRMMDDLIEVLENDNKFNCFHLDGQTIMIDDYLQIKPEQKERLYKLIKDKRLIIGPWFVMPDEFLLSGESLIRNLQFGFDQCKQIGTQPLKNGYLIDIFGHNSQMPQILKGFGIDTATLYRGIGDYPKDSFKWEGADGSSVLALKLDKNRSYSNFYFATRWPFDGKQYDSKEALKRFEELLEYSNSQMLTSRVLLMEGVDHIDCDPILPEKIEEFKENMDVADIKIANLEDYISDYKEELKSSEVIKGTLYEPGRSGINNQLLQNVLSSMVFIKQDNDNCETLLTGWAEPLEFTASLIRNEFQGNEDIHNKNRISGKELLLHAWKLLLLNHPHDSICGCSVSDVHRDNEYRFRQVKSIAESIIDENMSLIFNEIDFSNVKGGSGAVMLFNSSESEKNGVQIIEIDTKEESQKNLNIYDASGQEVEYQIISHEKSKNIVTSFRELVKFENANKLKIAVPINIPGFGYTTLSWDNKLCSGLDFKKREYKLLKRIEPVRYTGSMRTGINTFDTGKISLEISSNGVIQMTDHDTKKEYKKMLVYEVEGDIGNGWVYGKPEKDEIISSYLAKNEITIENDGPLITIIKFECKMEVPYEYDFCRGVRSREKKEMMISTFLTLYKNSKRIDVNTKINNFHKDLRIRVLFDCGYSKSDKYYTKTPYDFYCWDIKRKDYSKYSEQDTGVKPCQGIFYINEDVDSLSIYTKGLYEIEVFDNKSRTIALTLMRSFASEAGQFMNGNEIMRRSFDFDFSLNIGTDKTPEQAFIYGESWRRGIKCVSDKKHSGYLPLEKSIIKLKNTRNVCISNVVSKDIHGQKTIRLFNAGDTNERGSLIIPYKFEAAYLVDFRGERICQLNYDEEEIMFEIGRKKLITIEIVN